MSDPMYYTNALAADNAWTAELTRVYGKKAGDARYDERGYATEKLANLKLAKRAADKALRDFRDAKVQS